VPHGSRTTGDLQGHAGATHNTNPMNDSSITRGAAAMRRLRLRRAGLLPELPGCPDCGRQVRSARTAPLCSRCWRRSPAGREWNRQRVARQRLA